MFIHSNVRIGLGPLKWVLGAPSLHHWHHDLARGGDCNFANLMPWLDVVFGTYHEPTTEPDAVGVDEETPRSYLGLLLQPLGLWPRWGQSETGRECPRTARSYLHVPGPVRGGAQPWRRR